jgi:hypothetical protein
MSSRIAFPHVESPSHKQNVWPPNDTQFFREAMRRHNRRRIRAAMAIYFLLMSASFAGGLLAFTRASLPLAALMAVVAAGALTIYSAQLTPDENFSDLDENSRTRVLAWAQKLKLLANHR